MKRRDFIKNTSIGVGTALVASAVGGKILTSKITGDHDSSKLISGTKKWQNWSGNQVCQPTEVFLPTSEKELVQKLKNTTDKIRVVGGGHSFSPVVPSNQILASFKELNSIIDYNTTLQTATVGAGAHLYNLTPQLHTLGMAFANQGDIDRQTLGGAVSTSTHGTGSALQSFAGAVKGFRLVTADGQVIDCSSENNTELFYGGAVALGALGLVTQYDLQLRPRFKLKERVYPAKLDDMLHAFFEKSAENRNFELFPFFYSDIVLVKELNSTEEAVTPTKDPLLNDDVLLSIGLTLAGKSAKRVEQVQSMIATLLSEETRVGYSHEIYPSVRNVPFNEMEYELPKEVAMECLKEIIDTGRKKKFPIFFPMEVRTIKADNFWMSPFYQRETVSISIHRYHQYDYDAYFPTFDAIFKKYGGRPHWGKLSYHQQEDIRAVYPKYDDFVALRKRMDPTGRFSNDYIHKLFGTI